MSVYLRGGKYSATENTYPGSGLRFQVDSGNTLKNGLLAFWPCSEQGAANVNRRDMLGQAPLLAVGGTIPNSTTGSPHGGYWSDFTGGNYSLETASNFLPWGASGGAKHVDFTLTGWFRVADLAANYTLASHLGSGNSNQAFRLITLQTSGFITYSVNDGAGLTSGTTTDAVTAATTFFVVMYHNATTDKIGCSINNGTFHTTDHTDGVNGNATAFAIGQQNSTNHIDGYGGDVGVWNRVLTATELTDLYNGGSGNRMVYG